MNTEQQELSLIDILRILRNHIYFILITTSVFILITIIYAWFIVSPDYVSSADVMVQVEQNASSTGDSNFDLVNAFRLIDTVAELMEKDIVLVNAIEKLNELGYDGVDIKYLRDGLSVRSSSTSYFINISFIDRNVDFSPVAVDAVIEAVIEETDVADAFPVLTNKIRRTSFANTATYNSPNKLLYIILGTIVGLIASSSFIYVKELLSTHFRSKEEIESELDLQVFGIIPKMNPKEIKNEKK
jgi:capsular polysaccharide biosynthesis protein